MTLRQIIEELRKEGHHVEYVENKPPKSKKTGKRYEKETEKTVALGAP